MCWRCILRHIKMCTIPGTVGSQHRRVEGANMPEAQSFLFQKARFYVRTLVDHFYARSQNGEERLLTLIITVCPAVCTHKTTRPPTPTGSIFMKFDI